MKSRNIEGGRTRDTFSWRLTCEVVTSYEVPPWEEKAKIGKTSLVSWRKVKCANLQEEGWGQHVLPAATP